MPYRKTLFWKNRRKNCRLRTCEPKITSASVRRAYAAKASVQNCVTGRQQSKARLHVATHQAQARQSVVRTCTRAACTPHEQRTRC